MFDIGASELLLILVVAVIVIGPKDLPLAMRTVGRWVGKMRRVSNHFRAGIDAMVREAELEEMEEKWRKQNEAVMKAHPHASQEMPSPASSADSAKAAASPKPAESSTPKAEVKRRGGEWDETARSERGSRSAEPQLPLPPP